MTIVTPDGIKIYSVTIDEALIPKHEISAEDKESIQKILGKIRAIEQAELEAMMFGTTDSEIDSDLLQ